MLLRHTASALALAATLAFNGAGAPLGASFDVSRRAATAALVSVRTSTNQEAGRGPATICLGCVAAGVIAIASNGWLGVWSLFMVGGSGAVAAGGTIATCVAACTTYLSAE